MSIRLVDFIKNNINETYFSSLPARFILARELMFELNDEIEKKTHIARNMIPFMNIYNIKLEQKESENNLEQFIIDFPKSFSNIKDQYSNFMFGDPRLFTYQIKKNQQYNCTNGKVLSINKQNDTYAIYTMAVILFNIYFCYHPFLGRKYYESVKTDNEYNRLFFQNRQKFIFKLENNDNRFINGYHSNAFTIWNNLNEEQKNFWTKAFEKKFDSYKNFYKAWKENFGNFIISNIQTICNNKLDVIVINDNYPLILSDNKIGVNTINCYKCNNNLINNCENCQINSDCCTFLQTNAILTINMGDLDKIVHLKLYPEKILSTPREMINIFKVVKSKKINNLLGLKLLTTLTIKALFNNEEKYYQKDDIIPLFPGVKIFMNINSHNLELEINNKGD